MAKKIGGLGKGLSAIFVENDTEDKNEVVVLKTSQIEPNRNQPRRSFDEDALAELANSIKKHGVLQPILVRPMLHGGYQIVAGERRYRAARIAGLTEIPAMIRELTDSETMQIALIENLQRSDLTPLEEAAGYRTLMDDYGFTQDDVAKTVGKSRSAIANAVRLLSLPDEVRPMLDDGRLSAGHARALLSLDDAAAITQTAKKIADEGLSVREAEAIVKKLGGTKKQPRKSAPKIPIIYKECELALAEELGTKVSIVMGKNPAQGTLCIEFYNPEELFRLTAKLTDEWKRDLDAEGNAILPDSNTQDNG